MSDVEVVRKGENYIVLNLVASNAAGDDTVGTEFSFAFEPKDEHLSTDIISLESMYTFTRDKGVDKDRIQVYDIESTEEPGPLTNKVIDLGAYHFDSILRQYFEIHSYILIA